MTLAEEAKGLGVKLTDKDAAALQAQIDACNGKRKKLRLSYADALQAAIDAAGDPNGIGVRHAGAELLARTTLALAVRTAKGVTLGVAGMFADKPTPGRAWKDLQPWMSDYTKNVDKAAAWAAKKAKDRVIVTVGKPKKAAGGNGKALLAAILENPSDTDARLIYADWLTQQGDPRGEFIVVQCELVKATGANKAALGKREKELLQSHRRAWSKEATQDSNNVEFDRGFVGTVEMTGTAWASKGARLVAAEPITTLQIDQVNGNALAMIAKAPHTAKLARLTADESFWMKTPQDALALNTFLKSKHVGQVREISLHVSRSTPVLTTRAPVDTAALFDGVELANTEVLNLRIDRVPDSALVSLATIKAPKLKVLKIGIAKKQAKLLAALKKKFPKAAIS